MESRGTVRQMGLLDRVLGVKEENRQDNQFKDPFWQETEYGFAPKDVIKVQTTHERDVYPKYAVRPQEAHTVAASRIEDLHNKLEYLDSKTYNLIKLIRGKCINCNRYFIIPKSKKPPFFKCPLCSPENEKKLIELLLYLNPDNEIFASCPECNKYSYLKVNEENRYLNFHCKSCEKDIVLNKDHPIELKDLSDNTTLSWCSACRLLFEVQEGQKFPITCSRCESKLEPKK
jgi:hypothetical protein